MVLSQAELREAVAKGEIKFNPPLEERQWGVAGIDLRLGFKFTRWKDTPSVRLSLAKGFKALPDIGSWQEKNLGLKDQFDKRETYPLDPHEFVLCQTYERIWMPRHLIALVEGRSGYARFGISVHQTAPWIQPGWSGNITLEMRNGPASLYLTPVDDMPCQLTFFQLTSAVPADQAYGAKATDAFQNQESPIPKRKARAKAGK
jgi:dCTP deaminase